MAPGLRHRLAEKMAGEITTSDTPGQALKKWRVSFDISQGQLSDCLGVSPSVISDYESGRRRSPGTAIVGKIVDSILTIDESRGGEYIRKFSTMLYITDVGDDVIYDLHDYTTQISLQQFADVMEAEVISGSCDLRIYGYTIIDSIKAILRFSANEFNKIYGWSTERALIFDGVTNGKSPMIAITVTPFKPRCVVLHGIVREQVHPIVFKLAEKDRVTVMCTTTPLDDIIERLRTQEW